MSHTHILTGNTSVQIVIDLLRQKNGLSIKRAAIGKFVKSRSGGRKVYFFRREIAAKKSGAVRPASRPSDAHSRPQVTDSIKAEPQPPKPKWEFTYSERYNLKRLSRLMVRARLRRFQQGIYHQLDPIRQLLL